MKYNSSCKHKNISLALSALALATSLSAVGSCRAVAYTPPPATFVLEPAPVPVDAFDLYNEWLDNPDACLAKYAGAKLYCQVDVKKMGAGTDPFVQLGPIKFLVAIPDNLKDVHVGSKVEVVGKLSGMQDYTLIFSDCWVRVIIPQLTAGY